MAKKYHIGKNGEPAPCKARVRACRFGEHFGSLKEAYAYAEKKEIEKRSQSFERLINKHKTELKREEAMDRLVSNGGVIDEIPPRGLTYHANAAYLFDMFANNHPSNQEHTKNGLDVAEIGPYTHINYTDGTRQIVEDAGTGTYNSIALEPDGTIKKYTNAGESETVNPTGEYTPRGALHSTNGPAVVRPDGSVEYWEYAHSDGDTSQGNCRLKVLMLL